MDKFKFIKNGLVLTLDSKKSAGYFNLLIKNDKIAEVYYKNELSENVLRERYPELEVYDFKNKIIMPAFFNSFKNSSYNYAYVYLRKTTYSTLSSNISLRLLDKFFSAKINEIYLKDLFTVNFAHALLNGELMIAESSPYVTRDFYRTFLEENETIRQSVIYTLYDTYLINHFKTAKNFFLLGLKAEERLNNYSLSYLRKNLKEGENKLLLEIFNTGFYSEEAKRNFNRSLIKILNEYGLLSNNLIITNPSYIYLTEMERLNNADVNVIFCPSDFFRIAERNIEFEELIKSNINVCIGTGYLGKNVLEEIKTLAGLLFKSGFSYESYLRMAVTNPAKMFGLTDIIGSIERNKIANLTVFDLNSLNSILNIPEIKSERISEFIIENLTTENVSDVIHRGKFEISNNIASNSDIEYTKSNYKKLIDIVYKEGKFLEFKEKYVMRRNVDSITKKPDEISSILSSERFNVEVEHDQQDLNAISDFKIIGKKTGEVIDTFESEKELASDLNIEDIILNEISFIGEGLNFNIPALLKIPDAKSEMLKTLRPATETIMDNYRVTPEIELGKNIKKETEAKTKPEESDEDVVFKKEVLRFGFDEE
jgi:hypothetical protein